MLAPSSSLAGVAPDESLDDPKIARRSAPRNGYRPRAFTVSLFGRAMSLPLLISPVASLRCCGRGFNSACRRASMHDVIVGAGLIVALLAAKAGGRCLIEAGPAIISSPRACAHIIDARRPRAAGIREEGGADRAPRTPPWLVKKIGERLPQAKVLQRHAVSVQHPASGRIGWRRSATHGSRPPNAEVPADATGLPDDGVTVKRGPRRSSCAPVGDRRRRRGRAARRWPWLPRHIPERFVATNLRHDFESGYRQR